MERNLLLAESVTEDLACRVTEIDMKKLILIKEISNVKLVGESLHEKQLCSRMKDATRKSNAQFKNFLGSR